MTKVYLFKAPVAEENDPYTDLLESNKFTVISVAVSEFINVNIDQLKEKIIRSEDYSGLIVTSKRAVEALVNVQGHSFSVLPIPHKLQAWNWFCRPKSVQVSCDIIYQGSLNLRFYLSVIVNSFTLPKNNG